MAQKLVRIDDLDGSEGAETIRYAFAGSSSSSVGESNDASVGLRLEWGLGSHDP